MEITEKDLKFATKVIKTAKKLGVSYLKLGNLEFELSGGIPARGPALKVSKKRLGEVASRDQAQVAFSAAQEDLSVMHVADPLGFEKALIENDLMSDDKEAAGINEETYNSSTE